MRITNHSRAVITVGEAGGLSRTLPAQASMHTDAREVTLDIHYLPCKIEIAEEPEEEKEHDQ